MIATATALLIGAGISAAVDVTKSVMANKAAGKAADQQEAAANKAMALQEKLYADSQQRYAPFYGPGAGASQTLGSLMGVPNVGVPGMVSAAPGDARPTTTGRRQPENAQIVGQAVPRQPSGPPTAGTPLGDAMGRGLSVEPTERIAMTASSLAPVRMRAPDGEVGEVPAHRVQEAEAEGLVRL